jgi:hypothetical protein
MAAAEGNRYAEKHSIEEWEKIFETIYQEAKQGKFLSLQQAFIESDVRPSTERWLCSKYKVLATIKKDIADAIANEINKGGLKSKFNPAMSIWRLKQLGEKDEQKTDITTNGKDVNNTPIVNFIKTDD